MIRKPSSSSSVTGVQQQDESMFESVVAVLKPLNRAARVANCGQIKSIQTNYIIMRPKVYQRAGQLSLPHVGITKTEKIELKRKTDEQINLVNGLEP